MKVDWVRYGKRYRYRGIGLGGYIGRGREG